jgi:hypothetical protein
MSNGASKDYKFGTKNNWRRWVWNRIVERLHVRPSQAVVLYLAGADDLDRQEAIRRGFREENLIAVERNGENLRALREKKALAVGGDVADVLRAWPTTVPVHVVHSDLCTNFNDAAMVNLISAILYSPATWGAVFSFNLLRGREARAEALKAFLADGCPKHRGNMFANLLLDACMHLMAAEMLQKQLTEVTREDVAWVPDPVFKAAASLLRCTLNSYRSGMQTFDSCVFVSPSRGVSEDDRMLVGAEAAKSARQDVRRRIAAVMAHRTMRLTRVGPYAGAH